MRSWVSLLRTARASFGVLVLCAVGLVLPSQTHDMMTALTEGSAWRVVVFHAALLFLGFSAWYWARAALSARWGVGDTHTARQQAAVDYHLPSEGLIWLPRILFGAAGLIAFALLMMASSWFNSAIVILWVAVGWWVMRWRTRNFPSGAPPPAAPPPALPAVTGWWRRALRWTGRQVRQAGVRVGELLVWAPFGSRVSATLVVAALVPFAVGAVQGLSVDLPRWWPDTAATAAAAFPGPAAAVLGLGLMIGPLTVLTYAVDGWHAQISVGGLRIGFRRPPVLTALGLWIFVIVPFAFHVHTVRVAEKSQAPESRATLGEYFPVWAKKCIPTPPQDPVRPIIVAASGGATKAGLWAARVLYDIEQSTGAGGPAVFAISSVSGGSLGVAAYTALQSAMARQSPDKGTFCALPAMPNRASPLKLDLLAPPNSLYGDALGPALAGWLLGDMPRAIFAWTRWFYSTDARGGDSAEAIERAFEKLWAPIALRVSQAPLFDEPYLSLFYNADKSPRAGMPLWIANGTDVTTGSRILTIPIKPGPMPSDWPRDPAAKPSNWPFLAASDLLGLLEADVPISTAINNTARFPVLEPFGDILPPHESHTQAEVIDGGYFENEGLQTALELATWLQREGKSLIGVAIEPIIVQVTADADDRVKIGDIVRCGGLRGNPEAPDAITHADPQVLAPLLGVYNVRGGHSTVLLHDARTEFCADDNRRFFHFYLPGTGSPAIPMNWLLSDAAAERIWNSTTDEPIGNAQELRCMRAQFRYWMDHSGSLTECR
jgi:hypothetical protein